MLLGSVVAQAGDPKPKPVDIRPIHDDLIALSDGSDHFVVLKPFDRASPQNFFYGTSKSFYRQKTVGAFRSGQERFEWTFWEPRWNPRAQRSGRMGNLKFKDGVYTVLCSGRLTTLKPVPDARRRVILGTGNFFERKWNRRGFALARDETGVYFFVDRLTDREDSRSFRVFMGPRGNMKQLKMKNVVYDSAGAIFATNKGDLRLVLNTNDAAWVEGKKRTTLIHLPLRDNRYLIYAELGVYEGETLGTPCDDL